MAPRCKMICEMAVSNSGGFVTNLQDSSGIIGVYEIKAGQISRALKRFQFIANSLKIIAG